jgi:large subunit ribosomal protein L10
MVMVSVKKKETLKSLVQQIEKYPVVGILDMHKLPSRQLHQIKEQLKGRAVIRMVKKRVIKLALGQSKKSNLSKLADEIKNQPAMLFSEGNPFELAQVIAASKTKAAAKAGDVAPDNIIIPAGPTNLPPGPAIGDLQRAKIQAGVEGDKIVVKRDAVVAKKGDVITPILADLLVKLGVEPMEISLNLLAVWDEGMVFGKDLLFVPKEHYVGQLQAGYACAFNLAINTGHVTSATVPVLLAKAHREAFALAMETGYVNGETIGPLLAKADAQAGVLKGMVKDAPETAESEPEKKEEVQPATEEAKAQEEKPAEATEDAGNEKSHPIKKGKGKKE